MEGLLQPVRPNALWLPAWGQRARSVRERIAVVDRATLVGDVVGQDLTHDPIKASASDRAAAFFTQHDLDSAGGEGRVERHHPNSAFGIRVDDHQLIAFEAVGVNSATGLTRFVRFLSAPLLWLPTAIPWFESRRLSQPTTLFKLPH